MHSLHSPANPIAEAFDLCLKLLDIEVSQLVAKSGVSQSQIARFRKGERDMNASNFFKVMDAMPPRAKTVLYDCLEYGECDKAKIAAKLLEKPITEKGKIIGRAI